MKKSFCLLASLACVAAFPLLLSSRAAAADAQPVSAPVHDGFFFNTDVGPAWTDYEISGPQGTLEASSGGATVSFRFGAALTPHLVLSGNIQANATANRPDLTFNGNDLSASGDYQFAAATYGVGLTWYSDGNTFVGFTLGTSRASLVTDDYDVDSDWGYGLGVRVGHEWWVGDDWALGIVGSVRYMQADADADVLILTPTGTNVVHFDQVKATVVGIGFTATFN